MQTQSLGTLMDWNAFAAEMTAAIQQVDPRTIYSLHAYDPDVYTHQEEGVTDIRYPDMVEDYGEIITFDRSWLEENYQRVHDFSRQYGVPIYVGEFGVIRWVPDAAAFLQDQTGLFE